MLSSVRKELWRTLDHFVETRLLQHLIYSSSAHKKLSRLCNVFKMQLHALFYNWYLGTKSSPAFCFSSCCMWLPVLYRIQYKLIYAVDTRALPNLFNRHSDFDSCSQPHSWNISISAAYVKHMLYTVFDERSFSYSGLNVWNKSCMT